FFQAEDGIRDFHVTGVQTCALPISTASAGSQTTATIWRRSGGCCTSSPPCTPDDELARRPGPTRAGAPPLHHPHMDVVLWCHERSEERRVGKEGRSRRSGAQYTGEM